MEEFSLHRECKARTPVIPANLVGKLDFTSLIPQEDAVLPLPRNLAYGMSPKKQHEVSNLAYLVNGICQSQQLEYVVDLGSGMVRFGFISHRVFMSGYSVFFRWLDVFDGSPSLPPGCMQRIQSREPLL